jgi:Tol biopolymer transport system component
MWSPDGSKIAFLSFREGKAGIYLMNSDGSEERHLTPFSDYALQVAWCPK